MNNQITDDFVNSFFEASSVSAPTNTDTEIVKPDDGTLNDPKKILETEDTTSALGNLLDIKEDIDTIVPPTNLTPPEPDPIKPPASTPSTSVLGEVVSNLINEQILFGFEDDNFEVKTAEDLKELITANKEEWKRQVIEEEMNSIVESLPEELQYAFDYVKNGGTDMKNLFKVLAQGSEIKNLAPGKDSSSIARAYLTNTNYGTLEEIEEQIKEWEDLNLLDRKAETFKPKLEKMQEETVKAELRKQEEIREYQKKLVTDYYNGVNSALKDSDINGIKISKEEKAQLHSYLTENNYVSSRTGAPLNFLGKFLEKITWDEPDYKLLSELTLFAKDPEGYKKKIMSMQKEIDTSTTARTLRTSQGKVTTTTPEPTVKQKETIIRNNSLLRR